MPQVIETTVYTIDELSDSAKDSARTWYRDQAMHENWYEFVYDDFKTICEILGISLKSSPVQLYGGGTREQLHVWFRGFWNQGDGASFEGHYAHAKGATKAIRAHAPQDDELHRIADALQTIQKKNFWQLNSAIKQNGRYYHEYTMRILTERDSPTWQPMTDDAEDSIIEAMRDLARCLHRQLQQEYDYQTSDEAVDESIKINEWTFTESGARFG